MEWKLPTSHVHSRGARVIYRARLRTHVVNNKHARAASNYKIKSKRHAKQNAIQDSNNAPTRLKHIANPKEASASLNVYVRNTFSAPCVTKAKALLRRVFILRTRVCPSVPQTRKGALRSSIRRCRASKASRACTSDRVRRPGGQLSSKCTRRL